MAKTTKVVPLPREGVGGKFKLSKRDISQIQEMAEMGLRSNHIAAIMGFSKQAFFNIMTKNENIRLAYDAGKANGARQAIKHLMTHIENGSEKSLHFYLKFISGYNATDEYIEYLSEKEESDKKPKFPSSFKFALIED